MDSYFNSIIEINGLKEDKLIGRQYTWANNLPDPTYEKLDRVLVSFDWDQAFSMAVVTGMNRDISDHVPLLLKYGSSPAHCNSF
jgi:endonuclease/exonuclease/phosphatase family metal-dependent hydrolase